MLNPRMKNGRFSSSTYVNIYWNIQKKFLTSFEGKWVDLNQTVNFVRERFYLMALFTSSETMLLDK